MNRDWGAEFCEYVLLIRAEGLLIDLQWFADDNDENAPGKTEQPTEHKLKKLREEGQVAKSQEISGAVGLLLPGIILLFFAPFMLRTCLEMVRFFFLRAVELDPTQDAVIVAVFFRYFALLVWPILLVSVAGAIISNVIQLNGFLFTTKPLVPDFSKVAPRFGKYFKRIFSVDGAFNMVKSVAKILIIGFVGFIMIWIDRERLLNLQKVPNINVGLSIVSWIGIRMLLLVAVLLVALAIPDFLFQKWRFKERNKMTRYDIKKEFKELEGDPEVQSRIRSRFREMLKQNLITEVPKADVVVTNPTHLAIAVQYDQRTMAGPMVVAIGADEMSARIRSIAEDHSVPLVENKPLAWALFRECDIGDVIPEKHWQAVALVLSKVWYLNEERRRRTESLKKSA